ncbi:Holliday junction resolvase [archaeon]|jgi:holliday junction resolvase Hjr|nr:Holliday junction resolvase [archaeon]MBT4351268.1 Holliday junction resolvase [archaeon]MBT4648216.1 Holliday junction resolvase [archaeon]MBT6822266.1 Holliday junction resolvase [archaeon]MBT7392640.1 Holliday junction resolvase [archaeon]
MSKRKGSIGERQLINLFWAAGWAAIRSAGSGSTSFPSPDLLVGNKSRVLAIEAKVTKEKKKYFPKEEVKQLINFSKYFGAENWFAIKFHRVDWIFFSPEDLIEKENSFVASLELSEIKGVSFSDLIQSY